MKKGNINIEIGGDFTGQLVMRDLIATDSFNNIKDNDNNLSKAISDIAEHLISVESTVEDTKEVSDVFQDIQEMIADGDKPRRIKAMWNQLVELVPSVETLESAVSTIRSLFE